MGVIRPFRAHEVYAAACIDCHAEIEVPALPVPLRCAVCQKKQVTEFCVCAIREKCPIHPLGSKR